MEFAETLSNDAIVSKDLRPGFFFFLHFPLPRFFSSPLLLLLLLLLLVLLLPPSGARVSRQVSQHNSQPLKAKKK